MSGRAAASAALLLLAAAAAPAAQAQDGGCAEGPGGGIVCEILVGTGEGSASDLGLYNVALILERLSGDAGGEFAFSLSIDAGECGGAPRRFVEEAGRFREGEGAKRFNFPLVLHRGEAEADYCVVAAATECEGGCARRMRMAAGEGAVMRQLERPPGR